MQNNPVKNTKNTPKAAANSHRDSGDFSGLNFFPEGDSGFSPSLFDSRSPISTTNTPRGATINWDEDLNVDVNNDREKLVDFNLRYESNFFLGRFSGDIDELKALLNWVNYGH